jgi:hypothetical protein
MEYIIYPGDKTHLSEDWNGQASASFECEPDDIDTAYDALCEDLVFNDMPVDEHDITPQQEQMIINFQNLKDDDVKTMLDDAKLQGFISDYEINNVDE